MHKTYEIQEIKEQWPYNSVYTPVIIYFIFWETHYGPPLDCVNMHILILQFVSEH